MSPGRGRALAAAAWVVICAVCAAIAWRVAAAAEAPRPGPDVQAVHAVRTYALVGAAVAPADARRELLRRPGGPLFAAVQTAEAEGPAKAVALLRSAREPLTEPQRRARDVLVRLYDGPADGLPRRAAALGADDRAVLVSELGWAGRLAALPSGADDAARGRLLDEARRGATALLVAVAVFCAIGGAGAVAALVVFGLLRRPLPRRRYAPAAGAEAAFAASAAAFLVVYALVGLARALRPGLVPQFGWAGAAPMLLAGALAVGVAARLSPPAREALRRIGWTRGAGVVREVGAALAYLPVVVLAAVLGLCATLAIAVLTGADVARSAHPALLEAAQLGGWAFAALLVQAAVVAPVVEETVFRGMLYHHLRSATSAWGGAASVGFAAVVQALLFAAVHPQGALGVPMLAALGIAFALLRELRGSLIGPMLLHGLVNATSLTLAALQPA